MTLAKRNAQTITPHPSLYQGIIHIIRLLQYDVILFIFIVKILLTVYMPVLTYWLLFCYLFLNAALT